MKSITMVITVATLLVGISVNAADRKERQERRAERAERRETKADINDRIRDINRLDNDASAKMAGLRAVSHETGIAVPKLEAQLKEHPKTGIAGLLVANDIAVRGKKDVSQVLRAHNEGTSWSEIARNNGVTLDALESKLAAVESAMRAGK